MADTNRLVQVSMKLRGENPHLWDELGMVLREISASQAAEMVSCNPDYLLKAQGMAAMAQSLSIAWNNAPNIIEGQRAKVRK